MLDKDKVLNSCNAEDIANMIGMETFRKGKNVYIRCPGHRMRLGKEDSKPTNAILTPHGYKCFACGCRVNTIDMVSEFTGMPFYESLKYVASLIGGEEYYQQDSAKIKKSVNIPLSMDQYALLGIPTDSCKRGKITHISPYYRDEQTNYNCEYDEDMQSYISYDTSITYGIRDLFYDDYEFYCQMIVNCAENQMRKIGRCVELVKNPQFLISFGIKTKEDQKRMINAYGKMIRDIYKIYEEYCKKLKIKPKKIIHANEKTA